jgi:hypothetical protein
LAEYKQICRLLVTPGAGAVNIAMTPSTVADNYQLSNGSINEEISNLTEGSYTVNLVNKYGCKVSKTFSVKKVFKIAPKDFIKNLISGNSHS